MSTVCSHMSGEPGCTAQVCPAQVSAEPLIRAWMLGQDCNRIVDLVQKGLLIQEIQNLLSCCAISHCVTDLFCKTRSHFVIRGPSSDSSKDHWEFENALLIMVDDYWPFAARSEDDWWQSHPAQPTVCFSVCLCLAPPSGLPALKEPW